jgi:ATP synthase protein I
MAKWLNVATLATMIPVSTGVGFIIGYYLDKLFKTEPYLVVIWTILGIIAGFKNIIGFVIRENKEIEKDGDQKN